ncbi:HAMP domain-containing histidine kinase [Ornithinimicrobium sp. F0845]|uniref:sensor histidine kinase n=1 Tax=Ornithinimicrobium sp. F0845 TaxID=2926412 RepID=UPI001FF26F18|nr:HAMP domain-containing sensor histidine kinase [Ornithinimicrobium sp. F0845]MCK0110848.1 HAMP domain-containing histidine kinase [Ornithinimicrobium sp. F0845]
MGWLGNSRRSAVSRLHDLSLTARLVTVVVALVLTAYVITTVLTATLMRDYLADKTDRDLEAYSQPLAQDAWLRVSGQQPRTPRDPIPYYLLISGPMRGQLIESTSVSSTQGQEPDIGWTSIRDQSVGAGPFTVDSVDGTSQWRVLVQTYQNSITGEQGTVAVALPLWTVTNTVSRLLILTAVVGLATLLAVALISWFAVRRAFRPLTRIEDTAAAIAAGDLTRRIPERNANDEVASLSQSLNAMLAQIEQSFAVREASEARMRQFVADASHELRTPLATVKGYAELYRVGGVTDPEDVAGAMRRIEDESSRMARLVEDLLLLTRLDTTPHRPHGDVDLVVVANDVVQDALVRAPDRVISLRRYGAANGPVVVPGDDFALRQVLTNLVANAVSHTPDDTSVEVLVGQTPTAAVIEVQDHGPGIPPEAASRVFERFYRADPSRSRGAGRGGGTGLGLSIVASIVGRHGGTVRHRPTPGGGATFRVELPRTVQLAAPASGPASQHA